MTPSPPTLLARLAAAVVTVVPAGFAALRAAGAPQWESDLALVRDVALLPVSFGGAVSAVLTQLAATVPVGPLGFRASLVGALALGWLALGVYRLGLALSVEAERAAGEQETGRPLSVVLAALAALTVGLSPALQSSATLPGGPLLGAALALSALVSFVSPEAAPGARAARVGALAALAFVELPATLLALAPALALALALAPGAGRATVDEWGGAPIPAWRTRLAAADGQLVGPFGVGVGVFVLLAAFFAAPLALRPHAVRTLGDATHLAGAAAGLRSSADPGLTVFVFAREVGWFASGFALLAAASVALGLVARRRAPRLAWVLFGLVALDALVPVGRVAALSGTSTTPLRPLALAALGGLVALGLRAALRWIEALRLPATRSVQVLLVVLQATLLALSSEEASLAADRERFLGAEAWTDEALVRLEPKAAVYARTPSVAWRLFAAQLVRGERPDVLVIPAPLLGRPSLTEALRAAEPASLPLLRDVSLTGQPSEYALSLLADARPLQVEPDRDWSPQLRRHLAPRGLWVGYAPQPLGPTDRKVAALSLGAPAGRLAAALAPPYEADGESKRRLERAVLQQLELLEALKEREAAAVVAGQIGELARTRGGRVEGALGGVLGALRAQAPPPAPKAKPKSRAER